MNYEILEIKNDDGIFSVTITREKALNALNKLTFTELDHFVTEIAKNKEAKGIVLMGAGEKAFVAGADIKEFTGLGEGQGGELAKRGQVIMQKYEDLHIPVIAVIHGFALGGGCELAMACHMRIATSEAKFGQPEVNLGLTPGYGGTQRLVRYIGKTKAMELLLTGDMISGDEAKTLGLVNHVEASKEAAIEKAYSILKKISFKAPLAIAQVIKSVNAYHNKDINGFDFEVRAFDGLTTTEDFIEGATAFVERRRANFKGK